MVIIFLFLKKKYRLGTVTHVYHPNYLGGNLDCSLRPALARPPSQKIKAVHGGTHL
jgi:hypothetical protein